MRKKALPIALIATLLFAATAKSEEVFHGNSKNITESPFFHLGSSFGAFMSGRYEEALKEVNLVLESKDENAVINGHMQKGKILAAMKRYKEAIQEFNDCIAIEPKWEEAYLERSKAFKEINELEQARSDLQHGLFYQGKREINYNQFPEAIATLSDAIKEGFENCDSYNARGIAHLLNDDFEKAKADFNKASTFKTDDQKYWLQRVRNAEYDSSHQIKEPKKRWAILCSAIQTLENRRCLKSLAGLELNQENVEIEKLFLKSNWNVTDRIELKKVVAVEIAKGESYIKADKELLAWHLSNAICLTRRGYVAGYIPEEEVWSLVIPVAKEIQRNFDSWENFGQAYMASRATTDKDTYEKTKPPQNTAFRRLTMDPRSPWKEINWNTTLD